jgi:hypothetical protein
MHALRQRLLVLAVALANSGLYGQANTVFSDTFTTTVPSTPPSFSYFDATKVRVSGDALLVDAGQTAIAFFTNSAGGKLTLGTNESLKLSFDLSFRQLSSQGNLTVLRFGLLDSNGGTKPAAGLSSSSTVFQNYHGYIVSVDPNPTVTNGTTGTNNLRLRQRTPGASASASLMNSFTNTFSNLGGPDTFQTLNTSTVYRANFTISRGAGTALSFDFGLSNGASSVIAFSNQISVSTPSTYAFDAFGIHALDSLLNYTIDNVLITHTTPVPEPSTYAACAGAAVLGLAFWRRRRAAAKALAA